MNEESKIEQLGKPRLWWQTNEAREHLKANGWRETNIPARWVAPFVRGIFHTDEAVAEQLRREAAVKPIKPRL